MRYALLTPTFLSHSGIDRAVEEQAKDLSSQGHNVKIFCFEGMPSIIKNVSVVSWGMPKSLLVQRIYRLFFFLYKQKIHKAVEDLRDIDEIFCHFYPMSIIGLAAKKRFKKTYFYYDYGVPPLFSFAGFFEKLYILIFKFFADFYAKRADHIVTISKYLAQNYPKSLQSKITVQYIDIDHQRFHPRISGQKIRDLYGIGSDPVILFVGRISPHKGIHLLIKAFSLCEQKIPNAKLIIVGKSSFSRYENKLRKIAGPNVIFAGFVQDFDLSEYYAACTVYATASLWEGYDMPLVEAQACGKPVVAFEVGSHKEVIDNKAGILVKKNDINGFAQALIKQITNAS